MSPYQLESEGGVCGGYGVAPVYVAGWIHPEEVRHVDPEVCSYYLELRARDLDRREAALKTAGEAG